MAENKTKPTDVDPLDFIASVPDPARREEAERIMASMERLSGEKPYMYGSSIIGFGTYHYRYASGREGDAPRIGFSPRAREFVLYLTDGYDGKAAQLERLGKHRTGVSCLYIKRLGDVDEAVLHDMIADTLAYMDANYPRS